MHHSCQEIPDGGVTSPAGFSAAAAAAGIRYDRDDLVLLVSDPPAVAAGMFTTNRVQAAPVLYCRDSLARNLPVRALLVNSGNANACTGSAGKHAVRVMAGSVATALRCDPENVLVASTGTIGVQLPLERISAKIPVLIARLTRTGGSAAARAILTTDTHPKTAAAKAVLGDATVTVGGMAKGAGMIDPQLATLLAFITTDAVLKPAAAQCALREAVSASFNRVTVDGDQSTNDTVLLMANGLARNEALEPGAPGWDVFLSMLTAVCRDLAYAVVADGEGANRVVSVNVRGAADDGDAEKAARAVARSLLVKTSWTGADPNWGRIMCALGYSGASLRENLVAVDYDDVPVVRGGCAAGTPEEKLRRAVSRPAFCLNIDLGLGDGKHEIWSCNCSEEYVRINAAYMT